MISQSKTFKRNMVSVGVLTGLLLTAAPLYAAQESEAETAKNQEEIEVIQVTGIRGSLIQSMNTKRFSGSVVDSISAIDIGKLPDATIADSLQRITGIQITRSGGEGEKVNIRGNGNVTTTLNGEQMLAAGSITTTDANFSDIPSTMVSGLTVFKSSQARNVVSGLAGTIDLKTNRPFLLEEGWTALGKAEATQGSLGEETDGAFSGFVGFNSDQNYGFSLNVSQSTSTLADYTNGSQGGEPGQYGGWSFHANEGSNFVQDGLDINGDGDTNDTFYGFQGHQAANRYIERERTGINASFQVQLSEAWQVTADVFYTDLKEYQYLAGLVASQAWQGETGWYTPTSLTEYPNITSLDGEFTTNDGNYYTIQDAQYQARAVKTHTQTWNVDKEALNTNLELTYDNGGAFTATARYVHGEANNDYSRSVIDAFITSGSQVGDTYHGVNGEFISNANPWGYDGVPATLPDGSDVVGGYTQIPIGVSYIGGTQNWSLPNIEGEIFGSDMSRYSNKSSNLYGGFTNAGIDVFRVDGSYELDFENFDAVTSIDFGVRYGKREVEKQGWYGGVARTNEYGDAFLARWKDTATSAPLTGESYIAPISFTELNEQGMITSIDDFHGTTGLGTLYFVDPQAMKDPIAWHNKIYGTNVLVPDAANVYSLEEATTSLYFQANLAGDLLGFDYTGNIGFRYIETEFDILQSESLVGDVAEFNGQDFLIGPGILQPDGNQVNTNNSYRDFLPAINLAINLDEEQILRFAYTKTISTHDTDKLAGGLTVNRIKACNVEDSTGATVFCATSGSQAGNPLLKPNRQTNAEVSYEWYFSETGMFNLGVFFVQSGTALRNIIIERDDIVDSDGQVRGYNLTSETFTGTVPIGTTENFSQSGDWGHGVEVGYQQGFDFLKGFWSGFGVTANYTYSPSESTDRDYYGEYLPGFNNSEHQSNFALWYERDGIQARIAHNYRSEMYGGLKRESNYSFAYFTAPTSYVDASVSYDVNELVTVSLQGTNLTEEYQENYHQWESNIDTRVYNERRLTLSVQVKM